MEDLDFSGLLANCSDKGRTGYTPIMMYAVVTYANMRGIRTVDRIVELCERDLAFDLPKGINQSGMLSMNL
ncbi:transposase [Frisingicoccus sp.]|uniref:transposase n=1 Tax=Frisingicoccus sp. TaxID=1918627 RepID=UPI003AB62E9F